MQPSPVIALQAPCTKWKTENKQWKTKNGQGKIKKYWEREEFPETRKGKRKMQASHELAWRATPVHCLTIKNGKREMGKGKYPAGTGGRENGKQNMENGIWKNGTRKM